LPKGIALRLLYYTIPHELSSAFLFKVALSREIREITEAHYGD
jgi:hypothetical protein